MTDFVLDNSVSMRWLLASTKPADQSYAESVLGTLTDMEALVPDLWHLEAINVCLGAEKRGDTTSQHVQAFLYQLENLPIHVDAITSQQAFAHTITLARTHKLSSYDAAYLELAIREGLPLATLDKNLRKAAKKAEVAIYL